MGGERIKSQLYACVNFQGFKSPLACLGDSGRRFLGRLYVTVFPKSKAKPSYQDLRFGQVCQTSFRFVYGLLGQD